MPLDTASGQKPGPDETHFPTVVIANIPVSTPIAGPSASAPLSDYYLKRAAFVDKLSKPDPATGIRNTGSLKHVDIEDGNTVQVSVDAEGHFRAKLDSELVASGPRLARIDGSLLWRPYNIIETWRIQSAFAASDRITIDGFHYRMVDDDNGRLRSIIYVQNPRDPRYDFDTLEDILFLRPNEQPRAAIQVPPDNAWEIDPRLPFEKSLIQHSIDAFPELSPDTQYQFSRTQFILANEGNLVDARGLTTLRQVFNSWINKTASLHPSLTDPLLILPPLSISPEIPGTQRALQLPPRASGGPLLRLDFDPNFFPPRSRHLPETDDIQLMHFMTKRLERNGYAVFPARILPSVPALVFKRAQHDFVFFMTLHSVRTHELQIPPLSPRVADPVFQNQFSREAANAMVNAQKVNKLVILRGGIQTLTHQDASIEHAVFIVRDNT